LFLILPAALADFQFLDLLPFPENGFVSPELNVCGCDVVRALVITITVLAVNLLGGVFRRLGFLYHLDLLIDKMNQKSSLFQILKSVPWVLTSYNFSLRCSSFHRSGH